MLTLTLVPASPRYLFISSTLSSFCPISFSGQVSRLGLSVLSLSSFVSHLVLALTSSPYSILITDTSEIALLFKIQTPHKGGSAHVNRPPEEGIIFQSKNFYTLLHLLTCMSSFPLSVTVPVEQCPRYLDQPLALLLSLRVESLPFLPLSVFLARAHTHIINL